MIYACFMNVETAGCSNRLGSLSRVRDTEIIFRWANLDSPKLHRFQGLAVLTKHQNKEEKAKENLPFKDGHPVSFER